jgi:hypothetical protein
MTTTATVNAPVIPFKCPTVTAITSVPVDGTIVTTVDVVITTVNRTVVVVISTTV